MLAASLGARGRRSLPALVAVTALFVLLLGGSVRPVHAADPCDPSIANRIPCENSKPGNPASEWDISGSGDASIQGFATDISYNHGGMVSFKVSTPASAYTVSIYRVGYYGGMGARKIATVSPSVPLPQSQPACLTNTPTGLVDCGNWNVSATWTIPADAVSGVYFARLTRTDNGGASHITFVVRDDASASNLLFQTSDTTWQAYNQYGGNSVYLGSAPTSDGRAYKVSYNRPFSTRGQSSGYGTSNFLFYGEYPMIRFLEANGYDVSYFSGIDTDRRGGLIRNHRVFVSTGHDEYWSGGQRANVEAARAAGVNLAFFSGNEMFWKIRFENSIDGSGTPYRTLVTYKETKSNQPLDPLDPPTWTGTWRDPTWSPPADGGRPENAVTGTIFTVNRGSAAIQVPYAFSKLRFWRNTSVASLQAGQTATLGTQTLGYEWDEDLDNGFRPAGDMKMSSTTVTGTDHLIDYGNTYSPGTATHSLTLYRAPSGALVFGAGTVQWSWGLDVNHDTTPDSGPSAPDTRMQQATVNLLADMGAQPATLQAGLVAGTASPDSSAPTSSITSPAPGATVGSGATVTVSGTAADSGGGVVAGVEVSTDGGSTWHPASGTTSWTYSWKTGRPGPATIKSRAVDDSGNLESPTAGVSVTIGGSTTPAFVSRSTAQNSTSVAAPSGVFAGDVMIASLEVDANPVSVTGPSGWTLLMDTPTGIGTGSAFHAQVWYKVATATEPATYAWGVPANVYVDIGLLDYMNVSRSAPIDVSAGRDAGVTAAATTPAVTTTTAGDMLVALFQNFEFGQWTVGSGMTQRYNFDSVTAQDVVQPTTGSTGTKAATNSASGATSAQIVALRPVQTDTQPPAVSVTAPSPGSTVSGNAVALTATASDNVGVTSVQFQVDGSAVGPAFTTQPYATTWDSTAATDGSHTITARASDAAGNTTTSAGVIVTVSNVPPTISAVSAGSLTTTGALISWTTDRPSDSQVDYGTTSSYGSSTTLNASLVTSHSQSLSGLTPATTYHYRVKSRDGSGIQAVSGDFTFTTATPPAPAISGVAAGSVTASGATISWTTDTAADSQVEYGTTSAYGSSTSTDPTLVTSHSQALSGLTAGTAYHYRVKSKDAYGQLSTSGDQTFTTSTPPPVISGLAAGSITTSSATIGWTTDRPADSQVEYGTTTAYGSSTTLDAALVTSHSQALSGLSPGTTYHYRVKSRDGSGSLAVSGDSTFATALPPPPAISAIAAGSITASAATITWTTSTAADSQVDYGTTSSYGSSTALNGSLVTSHSQALSGLSAATTYHYRVKSRDAYGQLSTSGDNAFTTSSAPPSPPSFRARSTVTNGTTASKPAGTVAGDLLLASLEVDADPVTVTGPAGWTKIQDTVAASGTAKVFHAQLWYKVAGSSEPTSYAWSVPGGPWVDVAILAYSNVDPNSPIDVSASAYVGVTATPTTPAATTTAGNDMVVAVFINYDFGSWTAGTGTTSRYNFDSCTAEDVVQASPGAIAAKTARNSTSGPTTAQVVALRPK